MTAISVNDSRKIWSGFEKSGDGQKASSLESWDGRITRSQVGSGANVCRASTQLRIYAQSSTSQKPSSWDRPSSSGCLPIIVKASSQPRGRYKRLQIRQSKRLIVCGACFRSKRIQKRDGRRTSWRLKTRHAILSNLRRRSRSTRSNDTASGGFGITRLRNLRR